MSGTVSLPVFLLVTIAVVSIALLEVLALKSGIDGAALGGATAIIGALVGHRVAKGTGNGNGNHK